MIERIRTAFYIVAPTAVLVMTLGADWGFAKQAAVTVSLGALLLMFYDVIEGRK